MDIEQIKSLQKDMKNLSVLLIEDDKRAVEQVKIMLSQFCSQIDIAYDGQEGLEKYKEFYKEKLTYYDIIFTDINMPRLDGVELSKQVKDICCDQEIVIMSAYDESEILKELIRIDITNFLHKPIDFNGFISNLAKLNTNIKQKKYHSKELVETKTLNKELNTLINGYNTLSLASRTDKDGIITYISDKLAELSEYTKEELIGQTHKILSHPDTPKETYEEMWETITLGHIWKGRIKNLTKSGEHYWTNTTIGPFFDANGNIIGFNSIREDVTAQVNTNELYKKINLLLNNVNEGFLLFNEDLKIDRGYSMKCLELFNQDNIKGIDIGKLLITETKQRNLFYKNIEAIYEVTDDLQRELLLSLLPSEVKLHGKFIQITYKFLENNYFMLILKNITQEKLLKHSLKQQRLYQKMVISVVSNVNDFLEMKKNFLDLIDSIFKTKQTIVLPYDKGSFKRELHTFKGLFSQFHFIYTPEALHNLETLVLNTEHLANKSEVYISQLEDIQDGFKKDTTIIANILGEDYIEKQEKLSKNSQILLNIRDSVLKVINNPKHINLKLQNIASEIESMTYINVYDAFDKYSLVIDELATKLNKKIKPLKIIGDKTLQVPQSFRIFFTNLIHLFRNSIDHGIEDVNSRINRGKNEYGEITIEFFCNENTLVVKISDDGNGIDLELLKQKAIQKGLIDKDFEEQKDNDVLLDLVFCENFSTKEMVTSISGRGIGISALKFSVEQLNGEVVLQNNYQESLMCEFKLPFENITQLDFSHEILEEVFSILDIVVDQTKTFLINDLKLDIIDARYINKFNIENKITSFLEYKSSKTFTFTLTCSAEILKIFMASFSFGDEEIILEEQDKYELVNELNNTIIGLSLQDFSLPKGTLGIPYNLRQEEVVAKYSDINTNIISCMIHTNLGNIICSLLIEK